MIEVGDKGFERCYYPELSNSVKGMFSMGRYKPLNNNTSHKSQGSTATDRSMSPYPDSDNFRIRKYSAVEATEEAATAIAQREHDRSALEMFKQMMKMRSNSQF